MYDRYEELLKEKGFSNYRFAKETGISQATLSDWKLGKSTPKNDKLQIIADYFDVSLDYLMGNTDFRKLPNEELMVSELKRYEDFSNRDKKDIAVTMNFILEQLDNYQEALMFDGEILDDDTRELLKSSLINSLQVGKVIAKQKFTPDKHKK